MICAVGSFLYGTNLSIVDQGEDFLIIKNKDIDIHITRETKTCYFTKFTRTYADGSTDVYTHSDRTQRDVIETITNDAEYHCYKIKEEQ